MKRYALAFSLGAAAAAAAMLYLNHAPALAPFGAGVALTAAGMIGHRATALRVAGFIARVHGRPGPRASSSVRALPREAPPVPSVQGDVAAALVGLGTPKAKARTAAAAAAAGNPAADFETMFRAALKAAA